MTTNAILSTAKGVYPVEITEYELSPNEFTKFGGHIVGGSIDRYVNGCFAIKRVIFNDPATIVIWSDGSKTVVKCQPGDTYSKELGLAMCISKKALGNKGNYNEVFKKWIGDESPTFDGFRVGDTVMVVNFGSTYSGYSEWIRRNVVNAELSERWLHGRAPKNGDIGTILYLAPHERESEGYLAYVKIGESCVLINVDGLKKI